MLSLPLETRGEACKTCLEDTYHGHKGDVWCVPLGPRSALVVGAAVQLTPPRTLFKLPLHGS